jgi:hypothetical protein
MSNTEYDNFLKEISCTKGEKSKTHLPKFLKKFESEESFISEMFPIKILNLLASDKINQGSENIFDRVIITDTNKKMCFFNEILINKFPGKKFTFIAQDFFPDNEDSISSFAPLVEDFVDSVTPKK